MANEELRSAIPYFSHLKMTVIPTQKWVPTGLQNEQGQDLYKQGADLPGIEIEITPYMGEVKSKPVQFRFPSKVFLQNELVALQADPNQSANATALAAILASPDVMWIEDVLSAGGLPGLDTLWTDIFSDVLDMFGSFNESQNSGGGIPVALKIMQWDARFPAEGSKALTLKVGAFTQGVNIPEVYTLQFEDSETKAARLARNTQLATAITNLTTQLATASDEQKAQIQAQIDQYNREIAAQAAIERGLLTDVLTKPSVQSSLPTLLIAILAKLKANVWPDLDMPMVTAKLIDRLTALMG